MSIENNNSTISRTFRNIIQISSAKKRNLLRGRSTFDSFSKSEKESLRKNNSFRDSMLVGSIIKSSDIHDCDTETSKKTSAQIYTMTSLTPLPWEKEVAYTLGYVNYYKEVSIMIIDIIENLSKIHHINTNEALQELRKVSLEYGASNYLSYKLAYIRVSKKLSPNELAVATEIEDEFQHSLMPGLHYSALENIDYNISLFDIAKKRLSALKNKITNNFRKSTSLSNFIPTPISQSDVSPFLLKATESSLIDTIYSLLIILNLSDELPGVAKLIRKHIDTDILLKIDDTTRKLSELENTPINLTHWDKNNKDIYISLDLYRISSAFLEFKKLASYRNSIDKVVGIRLLSDVIKESNNNKQEVKKEDILKPFSSKINTPIDINFDNFYRTYLFLIFIENNNNLLLLSGTDISYIFENTLGLESLLTEKEMRKISSMAPRESRDLINILTLALFKHKSSDPDADYEFRSFFIDYVNNKHEGSIELFIKSLTTTSPEIANYIVSSLDEVTLEKMYTLVENSSEASKIRINILRFLGKSLNRIEYLIEADSIATRIEVSKLQQYFDNSRMYVDSISMKNWLDSNPSVSTEQFRVLNSAIEARAGMGNSSFTLIYDRSNYLISQIAKDAFEEFCTNREFGIESYLGRRIRHNTLDGVTNDPIDAVIKNQERSAILANTQTRKSLELWKQQYLLIVERLKKEYLQFKTVNSLFNSSIDLNDTFTKDNINKLVNSLKAIGGNELLNDLLISFCWNQISPQLESAARFIRVECLQEVNQTIDKCFTNSLQQEDKTLKSELRGAVNEVFSKVSDWFKVPQNGFISASPRELCSIILIDLNRDVSRIDFIGNAIDNKYTGISVHRLYDCIFVTLQNAVKHGNQAKPIIIDVNGIKTDNSSIFDITSINVKSYVSKSKFKSSVERISRAINDKAKDSDMITEGYSGIKKIKIITGLSEGTHTVKYSSDESSCEISIGFSLHSERLVEDIN